jgi:hypothetical protein
MSLRHFTDEEMQEYLDGNLTPENELLFETHLKICPHCHESLKQYQSLYMGLANDEALDLPKGFAKSVITRLSVEAKSESHFNYTNVFLTILGIVIAVGITFYYVDLKPLGRVISNILLPQYEFGSSVIASVKGFLMGLNGNIGLIVLAGLTLVIIAVWDRLVFQTKYRW